MIVHGSLDQSQAYVGLFTNYSQSSANREEDKATPHVGDFAIKF